MTKSDPYIYDIELPLLNSFGLLFGIAGGPALDACEPSRWYRTRDQAERRLAQLKNTKEKIRMSPNDGVYTTKKPEREQVTIRLLHVKQAASYLGMGEKAIRALITQGRLPYVQRKPGNSPFLIDRLDLDRWIEANKKGTL